MRDERTVEAPDLAAKMIIEHAGRGADVELPIDDREGCTGVLEAGTELGGGTARRLGWTLHGVSEQ